MDKVGEAFVCDRKVNPAILLDMRHGAISATAAFRDGHLSLELGELQSGIGRPRFRSQGD